MTAVAALASNGPTPEARERHYLSGRLRAGRFELLATAAEALLADGLARVARRQRVSPVYATLVNALPALACLIISAVSNGADYQAVGVLAWILSVGLAALYTTQHLTSELIEVLADDVVPVLRGRDDVATLGRWLKRVFSPSQQAIFVALSAPPLTVATIVALDRVGVQVDAPAAVVVISIAAVLVGQGLYIFVPALELPKVLTKTRLVLYSLDPAQTAAVQSLSDLVKRGTILAAGNASILAGGLFLWGFLGSPRALSLVALTLWAPSVALFTYHHVALGRLIQSRRRETLHSLQGQIDGSPTGGQNKDRDALISLHNQVRETKVLAIDAQQILALAQSLVIPLVAPALKVLVGG